MYIHRYNNSLFFISCFLCIALAYGNISFNIHIIIIEKRMFGVGYLCKLTRHFTVFVRLGHMIT